MEKISFQASYTRISMYAQVSGAAPKKNQDAKTDAQTDSSGLAAGTGADPRRHRQRNLDGDTFTLSIEAQTLQVSGTLLIDDSGRPVRGEAGSEAVLKTLYSGSPDHADKADRPAQGGLANALLDAMEKVSQKHARRHAPFHRLTGPGEIADELIRYLNREHLDNGGSRSDFAEAARKRLDAWIAAGSESTFTVEYREFRSEVQVSLSAALDSWVRRQGLEDADDLDSNGSDAAPA